MEGTLKKILTDKEKEKTDKTTEKKIPSIKIDFTSEKEDQNILTKNTLIKEENGEKVISGWNRFFMFVILGVNSRCMGFLFFLWISILIRIFKKTSGSYIVKDTQYVVNNTSTTISDNREVSINYGTRQVNLK